MSDFDAGSVTGGIKFNTSEFTAGIDAAAAQAKAFAPIIAASIDAPLARAAQVAAEAAAAIRHVPAATISAAPRTPAPTAAQAGPVLDPAAFTAAASTLIEAMHKIAAESQVRIAPKLDTAPFAASTIPVMGSLRRLNVAAHIEGRATLNTAPMVATATAATATVHALESAAHVKGTAQMDPAAFQQGMARVQSMMAIFPTAVTAFLADPILGFAALAKDALAGVETAIKSVAGGSIALGEKFHETGLAAQRLGVSVEYFDRLRVGARSAGVAAQGLETGLRGISMRAALATEGDEGATKAFRRVGISVAELKPLLDDMPGLVNLVQGKFNAMGTESERLAGAQKLMRGAGAELIPMFVQSGAAIDEMARRAKRLGATIGSGDVLNGRKFHELQTTVEDAWTGIQRAVEQPVFEFFAAHSKEIMPVIEAVAGVIRDSLGQAMEFVLPFFQDAMDSAGGLVPRVQSLASAVGEDLAAAWSIVAPIIGTTVSTFGALMDVGTALVPVLESVAVVAAKIAQAIALIASVAGTAIHGVATVLNAGKGALTGDTTDAQKSAQATKDSFVRGGKAFGDLLEINRPEKIRTGGETIGRQRPDPTSDALGQAARRVSPQIDVAAPQFEKVGVSAAGANAQMVMLNTGFDGIRIGITGVLPLLDSATSGLQRIAAATDTISSNDYSAQIRNARDNGSAAAGQAVNVTATVNVDPARASQQIADQLAPHVRRGFDDLAAQATGRQSQDRVRRAIGGGQ